ncbi:helix-turn-helix domain-containing protein [Nonomuraea sediminis]|uniref:helix-turn-helix domain-containing protein n=1 Tax=Nonomuraea sediminis TaxID=2835864 RepID=UPI0027DEEC8B|nr:helix-turn-helix transcriptional regulator [Nonomuraea sediminis]
MSTAPAHRMNEANGGPTVVRILLGGHLRRLREARGLTRDAAGHVIRASESKMCRLELGRVGFKERDVRDLLTLYGVSEEERASLLEMTREANAPGWWQHYSPVLPTWGEAYVALEEAASIIRAFEIQFLPPLLQTDDYARNLLALQHPDSSDAETSQRVSLRARRRQLLDQPDGPQLWAVIDEAALRRPIGGEEVMRAQIDHLIQTAETYPHITIQVLPYSKASHVTCPGFTLLRFAERDLPDVIYLEHLTGALYLDKPDEVQAYRVAMDQLTIYALTPADSLAFLHSL